MEIIAQGISDAWLDVLYELDKNGSESAPRGQKIKEILSLKVVIKNPKKRILTLPNRKISLPYAFGELVWYLTGRNDLAMMEYYSKIMRNFSDDGKTLNSAYGYRIFGKHPMLPFDQWEFVVNKLRQDPDSRQAIIHLHTPNNKPTKDEVCTLSLQFFIRNDKLDMEVNMRSNDIIWGFTYDVFNFTTFQELMANELGVDVGTYYHNVGSMHIYEKDFHYLKDLEIHGQLKYMSTMDEEFDYGGLTIHSPELIKFYKVEEDYRLPGELPDNYNEEAKFDNPTLEIMRDVLYIYRLSKYDYKGKKKALFNQLKYDNLYHCMMLNYLSGVKMNESLMIIVEGTDGSGKSTLISKIQEAFNIHKIDYKKPKDFKKQIYFYTALMSGHLILDRFYHSEWIYSKRFNRPSELTKFDMDVLDSMLNYRHAVFIYKDEDPNVSFQRLDKEDRKLFPTAGDLGRLAAGYEIQYRISNINFKKRFSELSMEGNND